MEHIHNYKIIRESGDAQIEVCIECKKKIKTRKDKNGRIDNKAYLKEHVRDTAQPFGSTAKVFRRAYPEQWEKIKKGKI